MNLVWADLDWDVPSSCPAPQPILPNFQLPKQNGEGSGIHLIYAIRDTLNFFLGLSLNFSEIFLGLVSYFTVNIDTQSLIFFKYFRVP